MQARGAHLARVVDPQASSPVGIAMLEDVIEELVGEVVDAGQQQTGG
jgi:CBS domain containing-hemolysin-like protein